MKKTFIIGLCLFLTNNPISADALKNTLTNIMHEKDSIGMVNLNGMRIDGKSRLRTTNQLKQQRSPNTIIATVKGYKIRKRDADAFLKKVTKGKVRDYDRLPKKQRKVVIRELVKIHTLKNIKSRPSSATIATVNGVSILKRDADSFLKKVTKGKVKDFDKLDKRQRKMVITDLAKPIILKNIVEHNLTQAEKEGVLKQVWLEKQKSTIQVSNEEVVALYEAKKRQALQQNANADVPKYLTVARNLRSEIVEKRITQNLMKDAKIEINFDLNASR